jgi:hypothetical protein
VFATVPNLLALDLKAIELNKQSKVRRHDPTDVELDFGTGVA